MCRLVTAEFDAAPSSVTRSRHYVADHLRRWELSDLSDTACLLTSELVTNAVVHAASVPALAVAVADGVLEVGVTDTGPPFPDPPRPVAPHHLLADGGRGLVLVDALAEEWGTSALPGGKQVWFRLDTADWSYRSACRCHGDDIDRVLLRSGRYALAMPGPWDDPPAS